jgi:ABC-type sugar transport system permease subunit
MDMFSEFSAARKKAGSQGGLFAIFRLNGSEAREARWGLFFISPWLIGFSLFYLVPMIASLGFSTLSFTLSRPDEIQFVGLGNWERMLFNDPQTWQALQVNLTFTLISLPIGMIAAFFLAVLLNSKQLLGKNIFRTLFYAPTMVPAIAGVLIWSQVLNPQTGWVNRLLEVVGIQATGASGLRWLDDPSLIYISYTLIGLWGIGNAMLINLAALQGVPTHLYEAAEIDGAGWLRRLWSVTIPMVTPVIFYNLVISTVALMQYFLVPYVLNGGDGYPQGTTRFLNVLFYQQAFAFQNMGYGAAIAWFIFIVSMIITVGLFATGRYWVYYAGDGR